jgi:hypothetical protein
MDIQEAVKLLEQHNKWRRGADIKMVDPKMLGEAIDLIVNKYKTKK